MVKKVDKKSNASPVVKSGASAARGLGLDKVKSAMTPDKVKISTPAKSEKKKGKVQNPEMEAVATPTRSSKRLNETDVKSVKKSESSPKLSIKKSEIPTKKNRNISGKKEITTSESKEKIGNSKETEEAKPKGIEENDHLKVNKAKEFKNTTEKESNEDDQQLIEEGVFGKIAFYYKRKRYGFIKRNGAKDADKNIFFLGNQEIRTPGLEVKFDVAETKKGIQAVNIEVLKTPENVALKGGEKLKPEKNAIVEIKKKDGNISGKKEITTTEIKKKDGKSNQTEEAKPKAIEENKHLKGNDAKEFKNIREKESKEIATTESRVKIGNSKETEEAKPKGIEKNKHLKVNEAKEFNNTTEKKSNEDDQQLIEEGVFGKVAFYYKWKKFGFIKRNDAKDGDKDIFFNFHQEIGIPGLEFKFDVVANEKGARAVNIEMLKTPENEALKVEWEKLNPIKPKKDLYKDEKEILAEGIEAVVCSHRNAKGKLERADGMGVLSYGLSSLIFRDAQGVMWRQRVKKETIVLCDVSYNYKYGIKDDNLVAINIRAVDGGPLANSRRIENDNHSNVDENVNEETRRPPMIVDALKTDTIQDGVKAFLKMIEISRKEKTENNKENLFGNEFGDSKISLTISGIKVASEKDKLILKAVLPHSYLRPDASILLIVKDIKEFKGKMASHETTHIHYMEKLQSAGVDMSNINVMPLQQLKDEFKEPVTREHLAKSYNKVLVDERLIPVIHKHLGKYFYTKIPAAVSFKKGKDLKNEISKAIRTANLPLTNKSPSTNANVANLSMDEQQISENIKVFMEAVQKRYPGGWVNVRSVAIATKNSFTENRSLIIYQSLKSVNDIGYVRSVNYDKRKITAVTDELSTIPGAEVTVLTNGEVRVKRKRDSDWDEIEGLTTLEEYLDEDEGLVKRKLAKRDHPEEEDQDEDEQDDFKPKKKKEDSDDDLDLEHMEEEYMRKVAEEEEEIERQEEENMKKLKEEENKNGEEAEDLESEEEESKDEESEVDDDIEVENMVESDEDGSEVNDDNLLMERNEEAYVSEDEAPKKKKSKKQLKQAAKQEKQATADKKSKSMGSKSHSAAKKSPKAQKSTKGVKNGKIQKKKK